jgi:hypothetical protein
MRPDDFGSVGDAYQRYSDEIRGKIRHELVFEVVAGLTSAGGTVLDWGAAMARYPRVYPKPVLEFSALTLRLKCCAGQICVRQSFWSKCAAGLSLRWATSPISHQNISAMQFAAMAY